jgi:MFS family permease
VVRTSTFASLRVRNYRWYFAGQTLSTTGTWMQRIAQDWLVLELTGSPFAVAVTTVLQFAPLLLFGLWGGVLADRYSKRALLVAAQCVMAACATTLAVLTLTEHIQLWHIYGLAFGLGAAAAIHNPARQAFVNEMVGVDLLRNAIALNAGSFQFSRLVGPAIGGFVVTGVGSGLAFAINAASFVPATLSLLILRREELHLSTPVPRERGQLVEGLRYVWGTTALRWRLLVVVATGVFGMNMPIILVSYAKIVFDSGAYVYGLLNTAIALGAVGGAVVAARRMDSRLGPLLLSLSAFGLLNVLAGTAPWLGLFVALLVVQGYSSITMLTMANAGIQLTADPRFRGRVMSLHSMVMFGGVPFGALLLGWITQAAGPPAALITSGVALLLTAVVLGVLVAREAGRSPLAALRAELAPRLRLRRRRAPSQPVDAPVVDGGTV